MPQGQYSLADAKPLGQFSLTDIGTPSSEPAKPDKGTTIYSNRPIVGEAVGPAMIAASYAPHILKGVEALSTPESLSYLSAAAGLAKAYQDLSEGHPIDAAEHAILGAAPAGFIKVIKALAPVAARVPKTAADSTLAYAKQAGERLAPSNVVANPTVGGAVDKYAESMGQRVVRLLGPNGEVLPSTVADAAPTMASRAVSVFTKWSPWLKGIGTTMGASSAEADALAHLNSPESIAKLATKMNAPGRERLMRAYKDQPDYVAAIKDAIAP